VLRSKAGKQNGCSKLNYKKEKALLFLTGLPVKFKVKSD
jgi:hypothetical protein